MLRLIVFSKKIHAFETYQVIARFTGCHPVCCCKLIYSSNNVADNTFINSLFTFKAYRS